MLDGKLPDPGELTAAADKQEGDLPISRQLPCGVQDGVQRVTRTVVARIHHHKLVLQPVLFPKTLPPFGVEAHVRIVRPGRDDHDLTRLNFLVQDVPLHEMIQHHDFGGVAKA